MFCMIEFCLFNQRIQTEADFEIERYAPLIYVM